MADYLTMLGSPIQTLQSMWRGERLPGETEEEYQAKVAEANMLSARRQEQQAAAGLPTPSLVFNKPVTTPLATESTVSPQERAKVESQAPVMQSEPATPAVGLGGERLLKPEQTSTLTESQLPSMVDVKMDRTEQEVKYAPGTEEAVNTALAKWKDARENIAKLQKDWFTTPEAMKASTNLLTSTLAVEDTLDPTSKSSQAFFENVRKVRSDLDNASNDLIKYQEGAKVDPERYMKNMPTTERILNGIGVFLEGMAAAKAAGKGVPVPPVGVIQGQLNRAIDLDIQSQKEEMQNKKESKIFNINRYKDNLALLNNDRAAEIKTKLDYLSATKMSLEALKNKYQEKIDTAGIDEALAKTEVDLAANRLLLGKNVITKNIQSQLPITGSSIPVEKRWDMEKDLRTDYRKDVEDAQMALDQKDKMLDNLELAAQGNSVAYNALKTSIARINTGVGVLTKDEIENNGMNANIYNRITDFFTRNTPGDKLTDVAKEDIVKFAKINEIAAKKKIAINALDAIKRAERNGLNYKNVVEDTDLEHMKWYESVVRKQSKPSGSAPSLK